MFVGLDFASDENSLDPHMVDIGKIKEIKLMNGLFDELIAKNGSNFTYDKLRDEWKFEHILLAKFNGDLNAGNVNFVNMTVQDIVIKKRKTNDLNGWQRVASVPYDKNKIKEYEFYDKFSESFEEYEYAFVPIMPQDIEGEYITDTVWSEFEDIFLSEKDNHYKIRYNVDHGSSERITKNATFEPMGSKYPIVVSNGDTNYEKGNINALVLSEKNIHELNPKQEMLYRKELTNFLTNNKPKVLKKSNGELYIIKVVDNPSIQYLNELQGVLANISFSFVEIGENTENDLMRNGLLERTVIR